MLGKADLAVLIGIDAQHELASGCGTGLALANSTALIWPFLSASSSANNALLRAVMRAVALVRW